MGARLGASQLKPISSYRKIRHRDQFAPIFWGIDDQSGLTIDATDSGTVMTNTGGVTVVGGNFGPALSYNGSTGYTQNTTYKPLTGKGQGSFSLRFWTKTGGAYSLGGWDSDNFGDRSLAFSTGFQIYVFTINCGGTLHTLNATATNFPDSKWHHLCGTYDGATARFYVDGLQANSAAATGNISAQNNGLRIAANGTNTPGSFATAQIDDVRVYNYALTPSQVLADYLDPWWRLRRRRAGVKTLSAAAYWDWWADSAMSGGYSDMGLSA